VTTSYMYVSYTPSPGGNQNNAASNACAQISDCEVCANTAGCGLWCDSGWGSNNKRIGTCGNAAMEMCDASTTQVTQASQCYKACNMTSGGVTQFGQCRYVPTCTNGKSYASASGASGCETEPTNVNCCVPAGQKRNVFESQEVLGVVEAKQATITAQVQIGGSWITCPVNGGDVGAGSAWSGAVTCPSTEQLCCVSKNGCNGNGKCVRGACQCAQGYGGSDCSQRRNGPPSSVSDRSNWPALNFLMQQSTIFEPPPDLNKTADEFSSGFGNNVQKLGTAAKSSPVSSQTVAIIVGCVVVAVIVVGVIAVSCFILRKRSSGRTQLQTEYIN